MERLIFREEQSFRQSFVPWILLPVWLLTFGVFAFGLYQQLYIGKPYGDNPMSDTGLIWSGIASVAIVTAVTLLIFSGHLVTEIWSDGIRYKFPPLITRVKHISLAEIASADVSKYNPIGEFGGWGWRKRFISRKTAYNISGNIGLRIILKDGRQVMFGTKKQEEMKRAVDKMLQRNSDKYSV